MRLLALALALAMTLPVRADGLSDELEKALEAAKQPPASARGDKLYGEKKFEEAAAAYLEHVTSRPEDGNAWYNLACCLALAGRKAEAVTALEQAVKAGFRDVDHIEGDSDLDPIRKKKGYRGIVSGLKAAKGPKAATTWVAGEALLPCLVVKPKGYSSKKEYGLILLLHGRGDTAGHFLEAVQGFRGDDFIVAALETPYVMGGLNGREARCWSPWESGKDNIRTGYLLSADSVGKALDALAKAYRIDPKRTYLLGFSEGAFLTAHCMMLHAGRIAGAIIIGGGLDRELLREEDFPKLQGKRILIAHGVKDMVVPFGNGKEISKILQAHGIENEFFPFDGGHTMPEAMREGVSGWLRGKEIDGELKAEEPK